MANSGSDTVSVINTATNAVMDMITVGSFPVGVAAAVTPNGARVYVANNGSDTVSVINPTNNAVSTIPTPPPPGMTHSPAFVPWPQMDTGLMLRILSRTACR